MEKKDIEKWISKLDDEDIETRKKAVDELYNIGDKHPELIDQILPPLLQVALGDEDAEIPVNAAESIALFIKIKIDPIENILNSAINVLRDGGQSFEKKDRASSLIRNISERHPELIRKYVPALLAASMKDVYVNDSDIVDEAIRSTLQNIFRE